MSKKYYINVGKKLAYTIAAAVIKDKEKLLNEIKNSNEKCDDDESGFVYLNDQDENSIYQDSVFLRFEGVPYYNRIEVYDEEGDQLCQNYNSNEDNYYDFEYNSKDFAICDFNPITKLKKEDGIEAIYQTCQAWDLGWQYSFELEDDEEFNPEYLYFAVVDTYGLKFYSNATSANEDGEDYLIVTPIYFSNKVNKNIIEVFNELYPDDKVKEEVLEGYVEFPEDDYKNYTLDPYDCFNVIVDEKLGVSSRIKTIGEFIDYKNTNFSLFYRYFGEFICELESDDGSVDNLSAEIFDLK